MDNSTSNYYGPVGETPMEIFLEKTFMQAGYLTGFGYGMQLILYIACVKILIKRAHSRNSSLQRRNSYFLITYITILCILDTMWTGVSAFGLQSTYIDNRNYPSPGDGSPGGPIAYLNVEFLQPFNIVGQTVFTLANILADAILLWRCRIIWGAPYSRSSNLVMAFPTIMLLASIVMGVMFGIQTCSPDGLYGKVTDEFGVPYFTISLSLNIILTLLIVGKIWHHRSSMAAVFGSDRSFLRYYKLLVMMFVESAALYSILSILLVVTFALGNPINQIWLGLAPSIQKISNYLIIYRVADGRAWNGSSTTTAATPTASIGLASLAFAMSPEGGLSQSGIEQDSGTISHETLGHPDLGKASVSGVHITRTIDSEVHGWGKVTNV